MCKKTGGWMPVLAACGTLALLACMPRKHVREVEPEPPPKADSGTASRDPAVAEDAAGFVVRPPDAGADAEASSPAEEACVELTPLTLKACAQPVLPDADFDAGAGHDPVIRVTGRVEEIVRGPWTCFASPRGGFFADFGDRPWRARVSDGLIDVWVGFLLPWRTPLVKVGDWISVHSQSNGAQYRQPVGELVVRNADGSLLIWVGDAETTEGLAPPPGINVANAADACTYQDDFCGLVSQRGYRVVIDGEESVVDYGQSADVGEYAVLHLSNDFQHDANCSAGHAGIAVVRGRTQHWAALDRGMCGSVTCGEAQYCKLPEAAACDRTNGAAACTAAADVCAHDCPGVCGCDGRFYCNACRAAQAGTDVAHGDASCRMSGCEDGAASAGPFGPNCQTIWSCFGRHYEIRCGQQGDGSRCLCKLDGQEVGMIHRDPDTSCEAREVALACGFPPFGYPPGSP